MAMLNVMMNDELMMSKLKMLLDEVNVEGVIDVVH